MAAEATLVPEDEPPPDESDEEVVELAGRLAKIVMGMREEGRANMEHFISCAERGLGGTATLRAPSKRNKRTILEADYDSERYESKNGR